VFLEKLGLERNDAELLRRSIIEAILKAEAVEEQATEYGRRFVLDFELQRGVGVIGYTAVVRTAWIVRNDEDFPRLSTCYCPKRSL
jgi:hypothetical protein